jgi:hypothetical protein
MIIRYLLNPSISPYLLVLPFKGCLMKVHFGANSPHRYIGVFESCLLDKVFKKALITNRQATYYLLYYLHITA